ncbi:MAG TPA: hypothetical protein VFM18_18920 [Methanosarcina sp.]|nr:hypothetical protein [Methanosarcina sp.]
MPCRDYESDNYSSREFDQLKERSDRLARIACKVMTALEESGMEDFILLQDDEVREWWTAHKIADEKARVAREKAERKERVRLKALSKLNPEELEALGIKIKKVKK